MGSPRYSHHTVSNLSVHIVWVTKYRYKVLTGDIKVRCRELLIQGVNALDVKILKGVVSSDHIHMHVEYPPSLSISDLVKRLKGRSSRMLQKEFPELKRRYWGQHFWAIGYGAWSTGNISEEMVNEYIEHHRDKPDSSDNFFLE
ncbi:MAG: IS200/IS605 family transposase [Lentisphaerales bacterium]|nr:IS200/IS605 family transposase [Lentisphaerales bacterium]NQZ48596.1 IS200/IS605 family transposase [Erythrobacter sp.]